MQIYVKKVLYLLNFVNFATETHLLGRSTACLEYTNMEKEEIFSGLNERLGTTQLSERTLSDYASAVQSEFSEESGVTDELWAKHVGILKSLNGNLHKDVSAEVKKWRDSQPAPGTGKPEEDTDEGEPASEPSAPEWFSKFSSSINKRFEALEREREKERSERADAEFRNSVVAGFRSKFSDAGITVHDYQFNNALKEVKFDSSQGVEKCIDNLEKVYNAHLKSSGVSEFGYPHKGSVGGRAGTSPQDEFFRRKASKEGWLKEGK